MLSSSLSRHNINYLGISPVLGSLQANPSLAKKKKRLISAFVIVTGTMLPGGMPTQRLRQAAVCTEFELGKFTAEGINKASTTLYVLVNQNKTAN